jgi:hypothetical protein
MLQLSCCPTVAQHRQSCRHASSEDRGHESPLKAKSCTVRACTAGVIQYLMVGGFYPYNTPHHHQQQQQQQSSGDS